MVQKYIVERKASMVNSPTFQHAASILFNWSKVSTHQDVLDKVLLVPDDVLPLPLSVLCDFRLDVVDDGLAHRSRDLQRQRAFFLNRVDSCKAIDTSKLFLVPYEVYYSERKIQFSQHMGVMKGFIN